MTNDFGICDGQLYWIQCPEEKLEKRNPETPTEEESDASTKNEPTYQWLCSAIYIDALATDDNGEWGKLLRWQDHNGKIVRWVMPAKYLLKEDLFVPELLKRGLQMTDGKTGRGLIKAYLNRQTPPTRARLVSQCGWQDDKAVYVMPDATYGDTGEIDYLPPEVKENPYAVAGTVAEWIEHVGKYGVGNSRLIFSASACFASPLLYHTGDQNCILHYTGMSSKGKTSSQDYGTSVAGKPQNMRFSWNNTTNGFEGSCAERSDGVLNLDEIGQVNPLILGDVVYMIANGVGKGAMNRDRTMRQIKCWRMLALSSGEIGLIEKLTMADKHVFAGQEVRMLNIPIPDTAQGVVENLHGMASSAEFIKMINHNTGQYYGTVFREFIKQITSLDPVRLSIVLREQRDAFVADVVPKGASPQVARAAGIFGLVAVAGMLACSFGLTGWSESDAKEAAITCFNAWLINRETIEDLEVARGIEHAIHFIETNTARFDALSAMEPVHRRLGFRIPPLGDTTSVAHEYYVYQWAWKDEVCKGYNATQIAKEMIARGWMIPGDGKNLARFRSLGNTNGGRKRMYHVTTAAFTDPDTRSSAEVQADTQADKKARRRAQGLDIQEHLDTIFPRGNPPDDE